MLATRLRSTTPALYSDIKPSSDIKPPSEKKNQVYTLTRLSLTKKTTNFETHLTFFLPTLLGFLKQLIEMTLSRKTRVMQ